MASLVSRKSTDEEALFADPDVSAESEQDLQSVSVASLAEAVVWGTDWTAGTIVDQLRRGTIALDPVFQRRDAWTDDRKSRFVESLMLGLPIPQLVLAENSKVKGKFLVIDGKQRLLSLSKFTGVGLAEGEPLRLVGLELLSQLNKCTFADIASKPELEDYLSAFENQSIRTVVIRGWKNEEVLYTIFHRLNTGSVPLSPQELRQALHPGPFLTFAATFSEKSEALQSLLGLTKPDFRMRDVELVVRYFAFKLRLKDYRGNLKKFLDDTCDILNADWSSKEEEIRKEGAQLDAAIKAATTIFSRSNAFRKWDGTRVESSFNRAVFDVLACSLSEVRIRKLAVEKKTEVGKAFRAICLNPSFRASIETTTKSKTAVRTRFALWYKKIGTVTGRSYSVALPPE